MCTTQTGGWKVALHNQTAWPFVDANGFSVGPGSAVSFKITQVNGRLSWRSLSSQIGRVLIKL